MGKYYKKKRRFSKKRHYKRRRSYKRRYSRRKWNKSKKTVEHKFFTFIKETHGNFASGNPIMFSND